MVGRTLALSPSWRRFDSISSNLHADQHNTITRQSRIARRLLHTTTLAHAAQINGLLQIRHTRLSLAPLLSPSLSSLSPVQCVSTCDSIRTAQEASKLTSLELAMCYKG
eukprot:1509875-Rhodomonas_salina.2